MDSSRVYWILCLQNRGSTYCTYDILSSLSRYIQSTYSCTGCALICILTMRTVYIEICVTIMFQSEHYMFFLMLNFMGISRWLIMLVVIILSILYVLFDLGMAQVYILYNILLNTCKIYPCPLVDISTWVVLMPDFSQLSWSSWIIFYFRYISAWFFQIST